MKVLVTGANGLLGHHVVMQLRKTKQDINVILRRKTKIYFDSAGIELIEGSFTDYQTLKKAATTCDAIIHIAAVTATDFLHYEDYRKINVDGSANVIRVAAELNIKTMVFVSTANTIGFGTAFLLSDETSEIQFPFSESYYARSKAEAENLFRQTSLLPDRHVIIINPTFLIGAFDTKPSSGKMILMGYKKRLMFIPKGGKNVVAASNVAEAICNALTQGRNGERYLTSGVNLSFREFYELEKKVCGYNQKMIEIPDFFLILIGKAGDLLRFFGIKTEVCSMNIRQLLVREFYSNNKAISELGLKKEPLEQAIADTIDWFNKTGKI